MIKRNIKMRVTSDESKQVQEICFANGIGWSSKDFTPILLDKEYLIIRDVITCDGKKRFCESNLEEVDASFFIRTQGTCVEETPEEELKQNSNKEETMEKNEVESYADVKEYLIAKGLYERVLGIDWALFYDEEGIFSDLFTWAKTEEGYIFWDELYGELVDLDIYDKIASLVQDYEAKQGKEFIKHLEAQPKEVVEAKPLEKPTEAKPKQYLVFVTSKGKPKRIHQCLESAQEEAKRLCESELCEVMVLEVVSKYQAKVIVEEV